ncbi:MAG: outer membrane lipoprotein-sorting protein [Spirochaetaceae bacterium]
MYTSIKGARGPRRRSPAAALTAWAAALTAWMPAAMMVLCVAVPAAAQNGAPSAGEIIDRLEENQTHPTSIVEGRMIITDRFGERTSSYIMHSEGEDRFLVEFTSRDEAGQRILRRGADLYLYYPDAREVIRLQGSALRDSLLGSDVSYEDMTGGRGILEDYRAELLGEESIGGRRTWRVELTARGTNVAYPRQIYYVDAEDYVLRKSEQYARSGRRLKEIEVLETERQGEYHYPTRVRVVDTTRRSTGTEIILDDVEIDVPLPDNIFSLEELSW